MEKDPEYFGEALQMCTQLNILRIMQFNKDFDADLLAQFFATVHLGTDGDRTLTWMTNGKLLSVKWRAFMELLDVVDNGLETPVGFRPHCNDTSTHKQALWPYCTVKIHPGTEKKTYELCPYLDILHRIFRETLFPRIGNLDQVHSYLVDMLLFCQHEKEASTGESLDISHVMWSELVSAVSERKCPIYGPFIMRLIERAWAQTYPRVLLETGDLVSHEVKRLRKKDNWSAPHTGGPSTAATGGPSAAATAMDTEGGDAPPGHDEDLGHSSAEPSWAQKLKRKMKKLFCLEYHGQYMTHVAEKNARSRHKELMRQLGATVVSGSEEQITEEEDWIHQNCHWTDSDAEQFSPHDAGAEM
ncbi:hypothetical protein ACQJBY_066516 [Aegilops geniculata]